MTWDELSSGIEAARRQAGIEGEADVAGYDVQLHDVLGGHVGGYEIDHDAQYIILKYEVAT